MGKAKVTREQEAAGRIWREDAEKQAVRIQTIISRFPKTFGLRAFPGGVYQIDPFATYVDDSGTIQLYVFFQRGDHWLAMGKTTEAELRREIVGL